MNAKAFKSYLLAGMIVWLPIVITFVILRFIIDLLDNTLALLPNAYQPEQLIGINIPGLGIIMSLSILLITGIIATNFFGQRLVGYGEKLLAKIPLVRSVYNAAKQVIQALLATNSQAFRKVLLIEYPRKGAWSLAFLTGSNNNAAISTHTNEELLSLYVPTTPNPTSGFLIMVPKKDAIELAMSVDDALKFIISLGVMQPSVKGSKQPNTEIDMGIP